MASNSWLSHVHLPADVKELVFLTPPSLSMSPTSFFDTGISQLFRKMSATINC